MIEAEQGGMGGRGAMEGGGARPRLLALAPVLALLLAGSLLVLILLVPEGTAMGGAIERFVERTFVFLPSREWATTPADLGLEFEDLTLRLPDGTPISAWYVPAPRGGPEANAPPAFLFCHGNAGNISHRVHNLDLLHQLGLAVLIFDYPGYGRSGGKPSEAGMYAAARAACDHLTEGRGFPDRRIVLFGRSIGTAAATLLAAEGHGGALILEGAFGSFREMARRHYPFLPLPRSLRGKFPTAEMLAAVRLPLLVVHGDEDEIVPLEMGRRVFEAAPGPKELYVIPGAGHNDTVAVGGRDYARRLGRFIEEHLGAPADRAGGAEPPRPRPGKAEESG